MKVRRILTSTILPLILSGAAQAASTSFTSSAGFWDVGTNWSDGSVPNLGSDVLLGLSGSTVFYRSSTNPVLNSVTIDADGAGATLVHALDTLKANTVTVGDTKIGKYSQSGGLLLTGGLIIGNTAAGSYTQTGGSLVVTGNTAESHLIIGAGDEGVGSFNLSGDGSVTANAIHVGAGNSDLGWASSGTFVQSGGTVTVTAGVGELVIGDAPRSAGKYTISGGTLTANQLYVGVQGANPVSGERAFVQSGGTVTVNDNLTLGGFGGGSSQTAGSYTLSGSDTASVLNTSKVWVGVSGSGTFTQEGGTHNVTLGSQPGDQSLLIAASQPGSVGVYNMKNGVLNAGGIYVGYFDGASATGGKGTLNQSGGTVNTSQLVVDNGGTPESLGKYVMTGGTLNTNGTLTPGVYIAGVFEHSGGTINVTGPGTTTGFRNDGTYTLAGGSLQGTAAKVNYGTFTGYGSIGGTGKLTNSGTMKFTGGTSSISAPLENSAGSTLEISGSVAVFSGSVSNRGVFKTTSATAIFNGPFSNAGQYFSDPSINTFNGGYINESGGYLTTSEPGDVFRIGGMFDVQNANSTLWNTSTAVLEFFKGSGNTTGDHSLIYAGLDFGSASNSNGFLGYQHNLSWGEVIINSGNQLITSGGGALYTEKLTLGSTNLTQITAQVASFSGDLKIYYDPIDNPLLQGRTFNFGSGTGSVIPVVATRAFFTSNSGFWDVGTNWSGGVVPGQGPSGQPSDAVLGLAGSTVFYQSSTNPVLNSVTIDADGAGATLVHALDTLKANTVTVGDTKIGKYSQSGGQLVAGGLIVGNKGTGSYTQTGGSLVVTGNTAESHLIIGAGDEGVGSFNLSGDGSVTANAIHVGAGNSDLGWASSGTFVQSGGTVTVTAGVGELVIGDAPRSAGKYTISGGTLTANQLYVGVQGANPVSGERAFVQSGGTVTVNDNLTLGGFGGGSSQTAGSYTLSGSDTASVLNTSKVWVGVSGSGTFTQEGGTHNVTLGSQPGDQSLLIAASQPGSVGVYNMKNGVLNAGGIYVGYFDGASATGGKGTLNQSGGTVNTSQLVVDNGGTPESLGKYVMTGGTLNTNGTLTPGVYIAGVFEHSGGTINVTGPGTTTGFRNDGTYTLAGGSLQGTAAKVNYGTFTGYGSIGGTGKLTNSGTMKFTGGTSSISAPLENSAGSTLEISGSVAVFSGAVANYGTFKLTDTSAVFTGPFGNAGQYFSDPSTTTFSGGYQNLAGGYLTTSEPGDVFRIGGMFDVQNANSTLWNTSTAVLEFFKGSGNTAGDHSLIYAGLDFGSASNSNGFLGYQHNLSWGEVIINSGNQLITSGGGALYTEKLTLGSTNLTQIAAQVASFSGDLKIYYDPIDNPLLQGRTFNFGSGAGYIAPIPEPSALLLAGVGAIALSFRRRRQ